MDSLKCNVGVSMVDIKDPAVVKGKDSNYIKSKTLNIDFDRQLVKSKNKKTTPASIIASFTP